MKWYKFYNRYQRKLNYFKDYENKGNAENEKNGNSVLCMLQVLVGNIKGSI